MYRNTRFGDLMKGLSRGSFEKIVSNHEADKHSKGLRCWDQLTAMVYAQLTGSRSLRELEAGFNQQEVCHYHLGTKPVKRSTLSDANAKRNSAVYADTCNLLLGQGHSALKKEVLELLYLIDSTPIPLKGLGYDDWARESGNGRTQGLKVHMMIESNAQVPVRTEISAANVNDIDIGKKIPIKAKATYAFDKGYYDYNWWYHIHQQEALFVTRFKKNAAIKTVKAFAVPEGAQGTIMEDAEVRFSTKRHGGHHYNDYYETPLRKVVVYREGKDTPLILATNDFESDALEIAETYKKRWEIELFFKWLKQNLKIKQFLGRSENAVKIQIYTALITYLLVYLYRKRHASSHSLKTCLVILKTGLFQRPEVEQKTYKRHRRRLRQLQQQQGALAF